MQYCVVNFHDCGSPPPGRVLPSPLQGYNMALRIWGMTVPTGKQGKSIFTFKSTFYILIG